MELILMSPPSTGSSNRLWFQLMNAATTHDQTNTRAIAAPPLTINLGSERKASGRHAYLRLLGHRQQAPIKHQ
ncbi:MAG: hypothetical protein QM805_21205 [Pseudomonas sp.]